MVPRTKAKSDYRLKISIFYSQLQATKQLSAKERAGRLHYRNQQSQGFFFSYSFLPSDSAAPSLSPSPSPINEIETRTEIAKRSSISSLRQP